MNLSRLEDGFSGTITLAAVVLAAACFVTPAHSQEVARAATTVAVSVEARLSEFAAIIPSLTVSNDADARSNAGKILRSVEVRGRRVLAE